MITTVEPVQLSDCMAECLDEMKRFEAAADLESLRAQFAATLPPFDPTAPVLPSRYLHERPPAPRRCALYRQYDEHGLLLYVGISSELATRRRTHLKHSAWTEFAAAEKAVWYDTIDEALAAEQDAIITERPLFNVVHAGNDRDLELRDYLLDRRAWHLLTPVASSDAPFDPVLLVRHVLDARVVGEVA